MQIESFDEKTIHFGNTLVPKCFYTFQRKNGGCFSQSFLYFDSTKNRIGHILRGNNYSSCDNVQRFNQQHCKFHLIVFINHRNVCFYKLTCKFMKQLTHSLISVCKCSKLILEPIGQKFERLCNSLFFDVLSVSHFTK